MKMMSEKRESVIVGIGPTIAGPLAEYKYKYEFKYRYKYKYEYKYKHQYWAVGWGGIRLPIQIRIWIKFIHWISIQIQIWIQIQIQMRTSKGVTRSNGHVNSLLFREQLLHLLHLLPSCASSCSQDHCSVIRTCAMQYQYCNIRPIPIFHPSFGSSVNIIQLNCWKTQGLLLSRLRFF